MERLDFRGACGSIRGSGCLGDSLPRQQDRDDEIVHVWHDKHQLKVEQDNTGVVWCGMVRNGMVWNSIVRYGYNGKVTMVWYGIGGMVKEGMHGKVNLSKCTSSKAMANQYEHIGHLDNFLDKQNFHIN